jgi:hypothetical protein
MELESYAVFDPGTTGPLQDLPRREAQQAYDRLMAGRPERRDQLRALLATDGVELDSSDAGIQVLNDWFLAHVEAGPSGVGLRPVWYSIVNDVALVLGDTILGRNPSLHWAFFTAGKSDLAYQRHVIMGFRSVANPKYNLDIDMMLAFYAERHVAGDPVDRAQFLQWIETAAERA